MAIENFTKAAFESALKASGFDFASAGVDPDTHQYVYIVTPSDSPYSIKVWSSLQASGVSGATAGEDSIRAVIVKGGMPYGGKNRRWVDRRKGWQRRLGEMIASLANQISYLGFKCNGCGANLMPFTSKTKTNPQRPFVRCPSPEKECQSPAFDWTEDEDGNMIAPTPTEPDQEEVPEETEEPETPDCPVCGFEMRRMGSGRGWRCNTPGNVWEGGKWSVCGGVIWDKPIQTQQQQNAPQKQPTPAVKPQAVKPSRTPQNASQTPQRPHEEESISPELAMLLYEAATRLKLLAKPSDKVTAELIERLMGASEGELEPEVAH